MPEQPQNDDVRRKVLALLEEVNAPFSPELADAYFRRGPSVLAQAVFLRAAWQEVIPPDDSTWIDAEIKASKDNQGIGTTLESLLQLGATREQLTQVVRYMQKETLWGLCCIVDNTRGLFDDPVNPKLHWHLSLFEKCPAESLDLGGLHDAVGDFDPAGDGGGSQMG